MRICTSAEPRGAKSMCLADMQHIIRTYALLWAMYLVANIAQFGEGRISSYLCFRWSAYLLDVSAVSS